MKPDPIYLRPGTYSIMGGLADRHIQELDRLIDRIQLLLGAELQKALAGIGEARQNEASAMINFTGAFTGLSTLLHFCSFTRGIITVEQGMETRADLGLVTRFRGLLVPIVASQCEILETSMTAQLEVRSPSLRIWYQKALAEVGAVHGFIGLVA
jgi:hypothetical protein